MKSTFARTICRILVASMIVLPWQAQAGLIGTGEVAAATSAGAASRGELAVQLQALGLSPQEAAARVAALTNAEVVDIAGRVDALPAGGLVGVLPIIVLIVLLWYYTTGQADASKGKAAPAPEKK